jgi:hypothetical protein
MLQQSGALSPTEAALGALGLTLAWKPDMLKNGVDPRDNLKIILEYFLLGGSTASASGTLKNTIGEKKPSAPHREAVINLQLPKIDLKDVLVLNDAAWTTFDEVNLAIGQNTAFMGSIWNYCQICVDPAFQEFFSRVEGGVSKLHFRAKPFKQTRVSQGTKFDDTVKTCQTLTLQPGWLLDARLRRSSQSVYNIFWVIPMGTMNMLDAASLSHLAMPRAITDPRHPSSLSRYGIRVMKVSSPYLPARTPSKRQGSPAGPLPTSARIPANNLSTQATAYANQAAVIAQQNGVPQDMIPSFLANMQQESNWDPMAVSKAGAKGLGQLMPGTIKRYGVTDPFDPVQSMTASAKYWRDLIKMFGRDPALVAAAYNAGEGAVQQAGNQVPNFPETKKHVAAVLANTPRYTATGTPTATSTTPPPAAPAAKPAEDRPVPPPGSIVALAEKWGKILEAWYEHGPLLSLGGMQVRGHPAWNIGNRLVTTDTRGEREFYIEGCAHRYDMRTGLYTTFLRVTRGWYLDGKTDEQGSSAGEITQTYFYGKGQG